VHEVGLFAKIRNEFPKMHYKHLLYSVLVISSNFPTHLVHLPSPKKPLNPQTSGTFSRFTSYHMHTLWLPPSDFAFSDSKAGARKVLLK